MSARQPWMKWYPADWRSDSALRMCSFSARGLWADMLTLMHEAQPYGYLIHNGRHPNAKQLAALFGGGTAKEVEKLLKELEDAGVFSRTEDGTIYSRRMVRDRAKSDAGRQFGKQGGNPALKGGETKQDNGAPQLPLNPEPYPSGITEGVKGSRAHEEKLEARSQKLEARPPKSPIDPVKAGGTDAVAVADRFIQLRSELWPSESALPAPAITLQAQAAEFLGIAPQALVDEVIERTMRQFRKAGKSAPHSLRFCRLSLQDAAANHRNGVGAAVHVPAGHDADGKPKTTAIDTADLDPVSRTHWMLTKRYAATREWPSTGYGAPPGSQDCEVADWIQRAHGIEPAKAPA